MPTALPFLEKTSVKRVKPFADETSPSKDAFELEDQDKDGVEDHDDANDSKSGELLLSTLLRTIVLLIDVLLV